MPNVQCNCGFNPEKHDGHSLRCSMAINATKVEAIEEADAHLNNVDLPTYSKLISYFGRLLDQCDRLRLPGQPESDAEKAARYAIDKATGAA